MSLDLKSRDPNPCPSQLSQWHPHPHPARKPSRTMSLPGRVTTCFSQLDVLNFQAAFGGMGRRGVGGRRERGNKIKIIHLLPFYDFHHFMKEPGKDRWRQLFSLTLKEVTHHKQRWGRLSSLLGSTNNQGHNPISPTTREGLQPPVMSYPGFGATPAQLPPRLMWNRCTICSLPNATPHTHVSSSKT